MGPRIPPAALLATALALQAQQPLSPDQLGALSARGKELAQRVRFEEACRSHLERLGVPVKELASPLMALGPERWFAWFLGPAEAPGQRPVLRTLVCPAGRPEALAPAQGAALPASLEVQADLLCGALRQLGTQAAEAHLLALAEPGGGASLYRMPRRGADGVVNLGRDFRLSFQPSAAKPFTFTRFHRSSFPLTAASVPKDGKAVSFLHNHLEAADPCETDVAAALLDGKLSVGVLAKAGLYSCTPDGTLSLGPHPDQAPQPEGKGGPATRETGQGLRAFTFDQSALDLENTWALQAGSAPDTFTYLCVYLDHQAGFTAELGGSFTLDREGRAKPSPDWPKAKMGIKIRLEADFLVAPMPEGLRRDLCLAASPAFLTPTRPATESPEQRLQRGSHLNHLGEVDRAAAILEPLHKTQPGLRGLAFELAYAYNALRQPAKALPVLTEAAKADPKDPWIARELAYSYLHTARYREAVQAYLQAMPLVAEDNLQERSEQAMNLAQAYQQLGDTANRDAWLAKARAWAPKGSPLALHFAQQDGAKGKQP